MIPRSNESPEVRSVFVESLGLIENAARSSRENMQRERMFRGMAAKPQVASPQNPNPPQPSDYIKAADEQLASAFREASNILGLVGNLHAVLTSPNPTQGEPVPALKLAEA